MHEKQFSVHNSVCCSGLAHSLIQFLIWLIWLTEKFVRLFPENISLKYVKLDVEFRRLSE